MNNILTKEEFFEKYKDVNFYFMSYEKYTFHFSGKLENGEEVLLWCGGNSDEAYQIDILVGFAENIYNLDPYSGLVTGENGDRFTT